jgi:competence protein ComEC
MPHWKICTLIGLLGICGLLFQEIDKLPDGRLHAHILDVGQGDSILLVSPSGKQIIVDGGPNLSALEGIGRHVSFFDRTIELLVLTHPDLDHIAAFPVMLQRYEIGAILLTGIITAQPQYQRFFVEAANQHIPIITADPRKDVDIGDGLVLDIVWPLQGTFGTQPKKTNDTSVVMRAIFGSGSILLTGDIEEPAENAILKTGANLHSTILKLAHHGSRTSTSTGFLLAAKPDLVVISLGKDNPYGHPHPSVIDRLNAMNIPIQRTDLGGDISLVLP